ncbi:hypothetical protein [Xanthobacter variabilis]|uniref:hypothetical protein n=1 Tax=Xanthobacter variabilis TaxID=3119932 RepID=UPI00374FB5F0
MKTPLLAAAGFLALTSGAALADRPLTPTEQEKVQATLTEQGCKGGHVEFDEGIFVVDNATCADGHVYDFKIGPDYKVLHKELEH